MTDWTFRPLPDGSGWAARLAAEERAALADLVDDVAALLDEGRPAAEDLPGLRIGTGPVEPPRDPAVRRLLPDASRADPDVAAEFRRLTEDDLRTTKLDQLGLLRRALTAEGPDLVVRAADAPRVAAALTDVRLVVAERLGVRTEEDADAVVRLAVAGGPLHPADPATVARRYLAAVSLLLSALQDSLVEAMLAALPDEPGDGRHGPDESGD